MRNGFVIGARIIYGKTEKTHLVCVLQGPHRGHTEATQGPLVKTEVFATFHALK